MKKISILLLIISTISVQSCALNKDKPSKKIYTNNKLSKIIGDPKEPGSIIVKFKPGQSSASKNKVIKKYAGKVIKKIPEISAYEVKTEKTSVSKATSKLENQPSVDYAEPNYIRKALITPNDPYYHYQYGLPLINAPSGWDIERGGGHSITIAIIDTGVDLNHPDLKSKIVRGYDFINNDSSPNDDHGHGTHVAGIAAAITNNSTGVASVSWGAKIMPVKVLNSRGSGSDVSVSNGIIWATNHGAKVINMSLGGYGFSQTLQDATNYAYSKGVVVLAAAGNDASTSILYPAGNSNVLGIGALDSNNHIAYFSNHNRSVDLSAPGVNILSTYLRSGSYSYAYLSGTSMATPFASGEAALLRSRFSSASASQIISLMTSRSTDLGPRGRDNYYGYGKINVQYALTGTVSKPTPRVRKRVKAKLSRSAVHRRGRAKIYGHINVHKRGRLVYIKLRYAGRRRWRVISHPRTDRLGRFRKYIRPRKTAYIRVIYGNTVSLKITVR